MKRMLSLFASLVPHAVMIRPVARRGIDAFREVAIAHFDRGGSRGDTVRAAIRAGVLLPVAIPFLFACRPAEPRISVAPTPPAAAHAPATTAAPATEPHRLVGRWLRADSNYTIEVARAGPDGSADVTYFNPQPIHVSRAGWRNEGARLFLFVELTDRGYPGNNYALRYDPGSDSLSGEYRHLGLDETYEVAFSRLTAQTP